MKTFHYYYYHITGWASLEHFTRRYVMVMRWWWWGDGDEVMVMRWWWWGDGDEVMVMRWWWWGDGDEVMRWWWWGDEVMRWWGDGVMVMRWWGDGVMVMRWWGDEVMGWWGDEVMRWWGDGDEVMKWWWWGDGDELVMTMMMCQMVMMPLMVTTTDVTQWSWNSIWTGLVHDQWQRVSKYITFVMRGTVDVTWIKWQVSWRRGWPRCEYYSWQRTYFFQKDLLLSKTMATKYMPKYTTSKFCHWS